jgi:hypothetical protein
MVDLNATVAAKRVHSGGAVFGQGQHANSTPFVSMAGSAIFA